MCRFRRVDWITHSATGSIHKFSHIKGRPIRIRHTNLNTSRQSNHNSACTKDIRNGRFMGISPYICMHIRLEEGAKENREPQWKLNPNMREEVLKEILKLLSLRIIYSVPDIEWVSLVHMVHKKSGIQVVKNDKNELVPIRLVNGWQMCIDYRKLNAAARKDHFPSPFIPQMLERLAGRQYFCFLDGYSRYFQIYVDPEDHDKTTFTCPFGNYEHIKI